jgi:hypothetical protein
MFECAGDDELGEEIFQEEEHEHGDDEDGGELLVAEHVHTTSTSVMDDPSPTPTEDHMWFEDRWMVASLCDE